jgi:uncharacterized membrane protein
MNELFYEERSLGQRAADAVTAIVGSWQFIIVQLIALVLWVALNTAALIAHWDPYPRSRMIGLRLLERWSRRW